jgi:nucleotide-binding universal stress UspA family protein
VIPRIQTIVVPIDFSPSLDRAVDYAAALAGPFGAALHLVHVVEEPFLAGAGWEWSVPDVRAMREQLVSDSLARLAKIAERLTQRGLAVTSAVAYGAPAEGIVTAAEDRGADLIVMSTHGRSGVPHLVLGSVAERVIRSAPCPVLAVRETREVKTAVEMEAATVLV